MNIPEENFNGYADFLGKIFSKQDLKKTYDSGRDFRLVTFGNTEVPNLPIWSSLLVYKSSYSNLLSRSRGESYFRVADYTLFPSEISDLKSKDYNFPINFCPKESVTEKFTQFTQESFIVCCPSDTHTSTEIKNIFVVEFGIPEDRVITIEEFLGLVGISESEMEYLFYRTSHSLVYPLNYMQTYLTKVYKKINILILNDNDN